MLEGIKNIHFIGIGGAGMSALAQVLLELGYRVSGSDIKMNLITKRLEERGAVVHHGHGEENLAQADLVIFSSAIPSINPELKAARLRGLSVLSRGEMLAELMRERNGIAVAGTHGKTTTTSMVASILSEAALDPTIVIGGELNDIGGNARLGHSSYLVAEADESDGSFLKLSPALAVVTNIEADHLEYYHNLPAIIEAFRRFVGRVSDDGCLVLSDHPNVRKITGKNEKRKTKNVRILTYGIKQGVDLVAKEVKFRGLGSEYEVFHRGERLGKIKLGVPGRHNIYNSLAAIGVALEVGVGFEKISSALTNFHGVQRRFEIRGEVKDIVVVDDYAHHPTEIRATLKAARQWRAKRIIGIFQPHRYTRTKFLRKDFSSAFEEADFLVITEIYSAGEEPLPGVSGRDIYEAVRDIGQENVEFIPDKSEIADRVMNILQPGDTVITMGAGDIDTVAGEIVQRLR
ncbi:UDP-N-acetylmuramate--L-alanine ligase [bacterium]|nr:UDP-N-acetylmuramate--L-alanine ligase [bacterium]